MKLESTLKQVSAAAAHNYAVQRDNLANFVDTKLQARADLAALIGDNPISVMMDNHRNHADFIAGTLDDTIHQANEWWDSGLLQGA